MTGNLRGPEQKLNIEIEATDQPSNGQIKTDRGHCCLSLVPRPRTSPLNSPLYSNCTVQK